GGAIVPLQEIEDVAERFVRARCRGVERRRSAEIAGGALEVPAVAAPLIGLAAAQVGEHRVLAQGDGAAVGLDRGKGLVVVKRVVAPRQQDTVVALARGGLVRGCAADAEQREHRYAYNRSLHGATILPAHRNFRALRVSNLGIVEVSVKQARVAGWADVGGREAALVQKGAAGEQTACADLVAEHQRMVVQLAMNLLGDRDEALDLSQEVFLRVFRTIHRFRGQSSLRTWIYRIAVNQARNRHRF